MASPMRPPILISTLALFALTTSSGCGGTASKACTPGTSASCACTNGSQGAQTCSSDGQGFGVCECTSGGGGSGGSHGAAGAGGDGATAGSSAGTGAAGAVGGQGGAGTTGSAGSATAADAGTSSDAAMPHADAAVVDGDVSPPGVDGGYSGRWVSVSIKSAIIAPGKTDGTNWDGLGDVDPDLAQSVAVALLGPSPAAAVLGAYAAPAVAALDKPDPYGDAQAIAFGVIGKPVALATFDAPIPNTFNPIWRLGWSYTNVPIDSDVRIGITLWDSDLVDDDPIDAVELNSQDLKDALAAQQVFDVRVDDQGQHQLLFVGVSVTQQPGPL